MDFPFRDKVLARLDRYVRIPSPSNPDSQSCPSTNEQLAFGAVLAEEMLELGLSQVLHDKNGILTATLPATKGVDAPTLGLIAHMDTFPGASGAGVVPQLHRDYAGGDIVIDAACGLVLSPKQHPELLACMGQDIMTASGKTLLGADDKAGIAIILTAAEFLLHNPQLAHGKVRIAITVDEEIGRGVQNFDVAAFGADFAYTLDGDVLGSVEDETFNADSLKLEIEGRSTHTGTAKNALVNAMRIGADIVASWPEWKLPETTAGREPFIVFERMEGTIARATIQGLVRDFTLDGLLALEQHLKSIVAEKQLKYPGAKLTLTFTEQYRNMKEILDQHPAVLERLLQAMQNEGVVPVQKPIRGGTDGARLSFMGLPTPNMFTGGANFHGPEEWVSVHAMEQAAKVVVRLITDGHD